MVVAAFAAIYVIWGSTYLFIRFSIETMPPFTMAAVRFLIAGGLMYAWLRLKNEVPPSQAQWRSCIVIGTLLLVFGNGCVVWSERTVPSGLVSLFISATPIWIALFDWLRPGGSPPRPLAGVGLIVGLVGVAMLLRPEISPTVDVFGCLLAVAGSICWSFGTIYSRSAALPKSPFMATACQMLAGGAILLVIATITGEIGRLNPAMISAKSLWSLVYLIVFGSIVAFSAYVWLIRVENPTKVATYAYVNPVVALLLGWLFAGELIQLSMLLPAGIIIAAVAIVTRYSARRLESERPGMSIKATSSHSSGD